MKPKLVGEAAAARVPASAARVAASVSENHTARSEGLGRHGRSPSFFLNLGALAIASAYLVVFVAKLPQIVESFTWNSDVASAFTLPTTLVTAGTGGHTLLSTTGAYVSLWFGLLTASLPLHRALWELAPVAVFVVAALAIGWSVSRVATRRAAILAVALALVVSPEATHIFAVAFSHNIAYLYTCLLGAYVVWLMRVRPRGRVTAFAVPLIAGVVLGVGLASDLLVLVCGIVPFAFTAVLGGLQRNRRGRIFALSAFATIAVAVPVALLTSTEMGSLGFVILRPLTSTTALSALPRHSQYMFEGLKLLFGGYLGGPAAPGTLRTVLGIAADVAMAAALLMLVILGAVTLASLLRSLRRRAGQAAARELRTQLHILYWTGSAVGTAVAFEFSAMAFEVHPEYYATLVFSVAAVAPLLMRPGTLGGWLVPVCASIFFVASLVGLLGTDFAPSALAKDEPAIVRIAQANHATTGYAGYWYSSNLTWNSHERVAVRPVLTCENFAGAGICPFYLGRVPSWYAPAHIRSFLLVNPGEKYLSKVPSGLGRPLGIYPLGGATTMYVYPYDIASRLGSPLD